MTEFYKFNLDYTENLFDKLSNSIYFDNVTKGRCGTVLANINDNIVPIIRTTTIYNKPTQQFQPVHLKLIEDIKRVSQFENLELNNALVEIYESSYRTMKYHSDQSLDLSPNSYIAIYSCYDDPTDIRKLKIKNKETNKCFEISLDHNSVVLFSYETNFKYLHKIVLENNSHDNKWFGITFRLSKTFIKFVDNIAYFSHNDRVLKLANDEEKREFLKLRGLENRSIYYEYPELDYTISPSDMLL